MSRRGNRLSGLKSRYNLAALRRECKTIRRLDALSDEDLNGVAGGRPPVQESDNRSGAYNYSAKTGAYCCN